MLHFVATTLCNLLSGCFTIPGALESPQEDGRLDRRLYASRCTPLECCAQANCNYTTTPPVPSVEARTQVFAQGHSADSPGERAAYGPSLS